MKYFKNNFVVKFIISLFLISVFLGIITFFIYRPDLISYIEEFKNLISTTRQNVFLSNIGLITLLFILSISIIGTPGMIFYLFYEGFSIGFTLALFLFNYKLKGGLFYIIFVMLSKIIYIIIILYFIIISIKFIKKIIETFIKKDKDLLFKLIINHFYRYIFVLVVLLINSLLIYIISNKILTYILGLI